MLGSATLELVFKGPAFNDNVSEDTIISKSEQFSSSSSNSTISRSDVSSVGTALSLLSFDKSSLSSASPNKISKKDGSLLSDRTSIGLKEVISIFSTYFSDGERLSKLQVVQSLLFLTRYYSKYYSHTITGNVVTDKDRIKESIYWLNFSCAAYGYLIVQYSGIGGGFISDLLKPDVKSAIKILGLNDSDMLVWEYKTGLEMFKPKFFICFDKVTNSIVVSFRGTLDIHDLLTDLNANFEPFYGGYAHRGILRSAVWVCEHYIQKILKYVKDYKCENLILTGHRYFCFKLVWAAPLERFLP